MTSTRIMQAGRKATILLDLIALTYCRHPSPRKPVSEVLNKKVLRKLIEIIEHYDNVKIITPQKQYNRYKSAIYSALDDLFNEDFESARIFRSLSDILKIVEPEKPRIRGKRSCSVSKYHGEEYRELVYLIIEKFPGCSADVLIVCEGEKFSLQAEILIEYVCNSDKKLLLKEIMTAIRLLSSNHYPLDNEVVMYFKHSN